MPDDTDTPAAPAAAPVPGALGPPAAPVPPRPLRYDAPPPEIAAQAAEAQSIGDPKSGPAAAAETESEPEPAYDGPMCDIEHPKWATLKDWVRKELHLSQVGGDEEHRKSVNP